MMANLTIDSRCVGQPWKRAEKDITWRLTTNYAAAIGDTNPRYFDDELPEGLVAHPMFAVTLGWPLVYEMTNYIDLPYPQEAFLAQIHNTTWLKIKRLMVPGVRVAIDTQIAAVIPHRAGTQIVYQFDVRDMDGEPFHTEYMGCLLRGVQCTDAGGGQAPVTPKERFPGTPRWEAAVPIHPTLTYIYDGCTDIVSDIHTSPRFAHGAGLPDIILQGTATIALGVREVINRELHGDPEAVELIGAKLTGMVFPGDQLSVRLCDRRRQHGRTELFFEVLNCTTGKVLLSYGYVATRA
jgi:hypothetical protein